MNVILAEDDLDIQLVARLALKRAGFTVKVVNNGQEAIDAVKADPPDLVFMDLKMPVMDGWEATKRIRMTAFGRRVAIIALTAQVMAGDEQKALAIGCDDYLAKPVVDPEIVREKVERLLKKYGGPTLVAVQ